MNENVQKKSSETNMKKYGVEHWTKTEQGKQILRERKLIQHHSTREFLLEQLNLKLEDDEYIHSHYEHSWKCLKCNNIFKTIWNNIQQGYLCPHCFPRTSGSSIMEQELYLFIKELLPYAVIHRNIKTIINPYELDIYITDKKIYIEFHRYFIL